MTFPFPSLASAPAAAAGMTFSYIGATVDTSSLSAYTFSSVSIGTANASRLIAVAVCWKHSTQRTIATVTIDGSGMTKGPEASDANSNTSGATWFYLPWASNTTATFVVDINGIGLATGCTILVYRLLPASGTPIDSVTATGAPTTLTDLEVKTSGVALFALTATASGSALAWNGTDTPVHDVTNDSTMGSRFVNAWSIATTENNSTRDATITTGTTVSIAGISFQ